MHKPLICIVLFLIGCINSTLVPSVNNITLVPLTATNSTTLYNITCDQCLCKTVPTHAILNCFPNNTCQYFLTIPSSYRIESSPQARLFFPNGQIPTQSQCCMKNTTELIAKLQNGSQISTSVFYPDSLHLADDGTLFVLDYDINTLFGYDVNNLTAILSINLMNSLPFSFTYHEEYFYISLNNDSIMIINRRNFTLMNMINSPYFSGIRDIIFIQKGYIMVIASVSSRSLIFFRRRNNSPINYTFYFIQSFSSISPYGLDYINDTFFLGTSGTKGYLYSFTQINSTFWSAQLVANISSFVNSGIVVNVDTDSCGRIWLAVWNAGILIIDQEGNYLGSFVPKLTTYIYDVLITRNNILYVADVGMKKIVRIDPNNTP